MICTKVCERKYQVHTIQLPWIIAILRQRRDDVRSAWEESRLAAEEMDDEFFVGGEEVETRRKVSRSTHICWSR